MRANETTSPPREGTAPPHRPVPAPRGTTGSPHSRAIRTAIPTSRASRGTIAAEGSRSSEYASKAYTARSSGAVRTISGPSASCSRDAKADSAIADAVRRAAGEFLEIRLLGVLLEEVDEAQAR